MPTAKAISVDNVAVRSVSETANLTSSENRAEAKVQGLVKRDAEIKTNRMKSERKARQPPVTSLKTLKPRTP